MIPIKCNDNRTCRNTCSFFDIIIVKQVVLYSVKKIKNREEFNIEEKRRQSEENYYIFMFVLDGIYILHVKQ
jgi:hypothetical protein